MDEQGTNFGIDAFIAGSTFKTALGGSYYRRPPALVICDGAEERSRLEVMLDAAGARLLGTENLAEAIERLDRIASVRRSEEHTSELQSLMRISYAVFCLKKNKQY